MLWTLLALVGFAAMIWYAWSAAALLRGASQGRMQLLWMIGIWQAVSALGAFYVFRAGLGESFGLAAIVGAVIAATNPLLWSIGNVANRIKSHGIQMGKLLKFQ